MKMKINIGKGYRQLVPLKDTVHLGDEITNLTNTPLKWEPVYYSIGYKVPKSKVALYRRPVSSKCKQYFS